MYTTTARRLAFVRCAQGAPQATSGLTKKGARVCSVSWGLENGPHPQVWQEQELQRVAAWGAATPGPLRRWSQAPKLPITQSMNPTRERPTYEVPKKEEVGQASGYMKPLKQNDKRFIR